jgi:hypothetical protein
MGMCVDELVSFCDARYPQQVLFERVSGVIAPEKGVEEIVKLANAILSGRLKGAYLLRCSVKYPGYKTHSQHFCALFANLGPHKRPIIRDPLQPGDHPFCLTHMAHTLHIKHVSALHEVRIHEDSPLFKL